MLNKLVKVNENYSINMYTNGYMVEVGGRDKRDDWVTLKLLCTTIDEVLDLVKKISEMEREV